jgi:Protein of unknown function (DUF2637)
MTPARPTPPAASPARDWTDTAIEWASGATAVAMFAYGVSLSYSVLHRIALAAGLPGWAADLWPLGFEAFMASAALNALADQRQRQDRPEWWQRVPWYPWALTALTAGGSILLNWFHPAIPLDPPPGWLVSLVYGLPPLAAVFAWHLFLQRLAHRRQHKPASHDGGSVLAGQDSPEDEQDKQNSAPPASAYLAPEPEHAGDPRVLIRVMLATETPEAPIGWQQVAEQTGLSRSRAYALLRQERARANGNGQPPGRTTSGATVPAPSSPE